MPQVLGVIGVALGGLASLVGCITTTIYGIVSTILGPVIGGITTIVSGITGSLGTLTGKIMSPLTKITDIIGLKLFGPLTGFVKDIKGSVSSIQGGLLGSINTLTGGITKRTRSFIQPLTASLGLIHGYVGGVSGMIKDELAPVTEMIDVVRSVSSIKMTKLLTESTADVAGIINMIGGKRAIRTARGINALWNETVKMGTGILTAVDDTTQALRGKIESVETDLKEAGETAIASLTTDVHTTLDSIVNVFDERSVRIDTDIASVTDRLESLPEFQKMLIRALA